MVGTPSDNTIPRLSDSSTRSAGQGVVFSEGAAASLTKPRERESRLSRCAPSTYLEHEIARVTRPYDILLIITGAVLFVLLALIATSYFFGGLPC